MLHANFAGLLLTSWASSECPANASDRDLNSIFARSKSLIENLLDAELLKARWNEQADDVRAAKKLGSVLIMLMGYNLVSIASVPDMIRGLREAGVAAARFSASAGACTLLEEAQVCGSGTYAASEAAELASQLYRSADHHEMHLVRLH